MEKYESLRMECLENKKEIMNNKEYYAKYFSEGRKSLEKLLLSCYERNIMTQACCSGHKDNMYFGGYSDSYVFMKLNKSDLGLASTILDECRKGDLKDICFVQEEIQNDPSFKNEFLLYIRCNYMFADLMYDRLINIISGSDNKDLSLEYQLLVLLKNVFLKRRQKYTNHSTLSSMSLFQIGDLNSLFVPGNYIKFETNGDVIADLPNNKNVGDIETVIKYINDCSHIDYDVLKGKYQYEDDKQLYELKNVLLKKIK